MRTKIEINVKMNNRNIPSAVRNAVWNIYVGNDIKQGICFCCNTEPITTANFDCGHVESRNNNGKATIQNLRPICGLCNKSMGTKNMETFMENSGFKKNINWYGIKKDSFDDIKNDELVNVKNNDSVNVKNNDLVNVVHNSANNDLVYVKNNSVINVKNDNGIKNNGLYYCKYCDYKASNNYRLDRHYETPKHLKNKKNARMITNTRTITNARTITNKKSENIENVKNTKKTNNKKEKCKNCEILKNEYILLKKQYENLEKNLQIKEEKYDTLVDKLLLQTKEEKYDALVDKLLLQTNEEKNKLFDKLLSQTNKTHNNTYVTELYTLNI